MELTEREKELIAETARVCMTEHPCKFDEFKERTHLHAFSRACEIHDVKEDDLLIMVFSAKTFSGVVKRAMIGGVVVLCVIVLAVFSGYLFQNPGAIMKCIGR